jgi:hypothetical protein
MYFPTAFSPYPADGTDECPVCLEGIRRKQMLPCGHALCTGCAGKMSSMNCTDISNVTDFTCPLCRGQSPSFGFQQLDIITIDTADRTFDVVIGSFEDVPHLALRPIRGEIVADFRTRWCRPGYDMQQFDYIAGTLLSADAGHAHQIFCDIVASARPRCFSCGTLHPRFKCTRCKIAVYCSQDCQRLHWSVDHKSVCKK